MRLLVGLESIDSTLMSTARWREQFLKIGVAIGGVLKRKSNRDGRRHKA